MTHAGDHDDDDDGYRGPASVRLADGQVLDVEVTLRGYVEPLDGRYHWYGRVAVHAELEALLGGKRAQAVVSTPQGEAAGELSDVDPWGRYRIAGVSTPPFAVVTEVPA
ncbi:DUF4873 domain-containing protein [Actinomycetospora sp. CA-084318]|uniref:DUF4873 domain-containing protein n=1 Tax=Actinomycetospora sp. CA-084318 TaxID=3239892 RepID=UPI003D97B878